MVSIAVQGLCPQEGALLAELSVRHYVSSQPTKAAPLAEALHENPLHQRGWAPAVGQAHWPSASACFPQAGRRNNTSVQFSEEPRPSGKNLLEDPELGRKASKRAQAAAMPRRPQPCLGKPPICSISKPKKEKAASTSLPIFLGSKYTSCL